MDEFFKVKFNDLAVGDNTTRDIFDINGRLLLCANSPISSPDQIRRLVAKGFLKREKQSRAEHIAKPARIKYTRGSNPFAEVENIKFILERMQGHFDRPNERSKRFMVNGAKEVTSIIASFANRQPDELLGAAHWPTETPYSIMHPIRKAIFAYFLAANRLGWGFEDIVSLLGACLTCNMSMSSLHDELHKQTNGITHDQWVQIQQHPENAYNKLVALGIEDDIWLQSVLQHHERMDGTGYPLGFDDSLSMKIYSSAKVIAVVDSYAALIGDAAHREGFNSKKALAELYGMGRFGLQQDLVKKIIMEMGTYPPGTVVRLEEGEVAVVTERVANRVAPICRIIIGVDRRRVMQPFRVDTSKEGSKIVEVLASRDYLPFIQPHLIWRLPIKQRTHVA